jgi:hypothetical protein
VNRDPSRHWQATGCDRLGGGLTTFIGAHTVLIARSVPSVKIRRLRAKVFNTTAPEFKESSKRQVREIAVVAAGGL